MGKHYGREIIGKVLELRESGLTHKEIGEKYGLKKEQITELIKGYNKRQKKILSGETIRHKGRQRIRNLTKEQEQELEIKRLRTENDLLRSFLQAAGRM